MLSDLRQLVTHCCFREAAQVMVAGFFLSATASALAAPGPLQNPASLFRITFKTNDVIAFIGGADVAAAQHSGHLEALLAIAFRDLRLRFRNFGWEGDTVYSQPRDVGFLSLKANLERAGVTVVFSQLGRAEALDATATEKKFISAYNHFLQDFTGSGVRFILVTPPPFEAARPPIPDLSSKNSRLSAYVHAIRGLAASRGLPVIDLFSALRSPGPDTPRLTDNGLQLSPQGHAAVAAACLRELGMARIADATGPANLPGVWPNAEFETVRRAVIEKNRLWFNYSRPQNWAFLGGDRITQPSSHDHRDQSVRWFPAEMEKFVPLITRAESAIKAAAARTTTP